MPNDAWKGALGDSIRAVFAEPVKPLPNFEPKYTVTQIAKELFTGYLNKQRNIVILNIGETTKKPFLYKENVFAKPQVVFQLSGTKETLFKTIAAHKKEIITTLDKAETVAFNNDLNAKTNDEQLKAIAPLGLKIRVPKSFRLAEKKGNFFWYIKDVKHGYSNLILSEFAMDETPFDSIPNYILEKRGVIGENIPGEIAGSHLISEMKFSPYVSETIFKGHRAFVSKGLWKMSGEYKGGPYINYTIEDTLNKRYLVLEGFIYAPNTKKRNYLFELEAAIQTAEIIKKQ